MTETATAAPATAPVVTPANILEPASVSVPEKLNIPATPSAEAAKQPEEAKDPGAQDAAQENPENSDPKKGRAQTRIHELTAQKYEAERRANDAIAEAQRLREQLRSRPDIDPNDFNAQEAERLRRVVKEERFEDTVSNVRKAQKEATDARISMFDAKVEAARERIPDMDAALREFTQLPLSPEAADVLVESDKAAEIAYFLAKNPEQAHRIARLPAAKQGAELTRIEARISVAQPRKATAAPPPVPMIGASSAPSAPTLTSASVEEIGAMLGYGKSK